MPPQGCPSRDCFNTQPPEGGWDGIHNIPFGRTVSTHSRPKAAGFWLYPPRDGKRIVSTHSRPKAAGVARQGAGSAAHVSTHSRPKAAGPKSIRAIWASLFQHTAARRRLDVIPVNFGTVNRFQHTAARRRLGQCSLIRRCLLLFQHTAARRRLGTKHDIFFLFLHVSTHSRPKAAGPHQQPSRPWQRFQHTAARRRLAPDGNGAAADLLFQHTAARRRLANETVVRFPDGAVSTHSRPKAAGH